MTLIAIEELEAGMTTAKNVVNQRGQVLLPKDTELNSKHILGLRSWSIHFVDVLLGSETNTQHLTEEQQLLLTDVLSSNFSQNIEDEGNLLIQQLKELYFEHLQTLSGELDAMSPVINPSDAILEPKLAEKWLTVPHLIQDAKSMTTIPEIKQKLNMEMSRPDISISNVGEILAFDPVLSALVIKMSNSAWYGANLRASTVPRAVAVIGYEDIKKSVHDAAVATDYADFESYCATPYSFWIHSCATSVFAQIISEQILYADTEQMALLGLLHDMGKQLLYTQIPKQYEQICRYAWRIKTPVLKIERKYLGFYHNMLTMELLKYWNFSKTNQDIVYFHHAPENATHKKEAYIIHLADALANAMGFSIQKFSVQPAVDVNVLKELKLKDQHLSAIIAQGQQRILTIKRALHIS